MTLIDVPISGEEHKSQLKQLQTDIEVLDHKIKQYVNHLRYTRKYRTRAIKKAITRQFGKQINEIDARSNNLEIKQKEQVQTPAMKIFRDKQLLLERPKELRSEDIDEDKKLFQVYRTARKMQNKILKKLF